MGIIIREIDLGSDFGYFSTIFVEPSSMGLGLAKGLIGQVESWFSEKEISKVIYNTADDHRVIIRLFKSYGYNITHTESGMVQLTKLLA